MSTNNHNAMFILHVVLSCLTKSHFVVIPRRFLSFSFHVSKLHLATLDRKIELLPDLCKIIVRIKAPAIALELCVLAINYYQIFDRYVQKIDSRCRCDATKWAANKLEHTLAGSCICTIVSPPAYVCVFLLWLVLQLTWITGIAYRCSSSRPRFPRVRPAI